MMNAKDIIAEKAKEFIGEVPDHIRYLLMDLFDYNYAYWIMDLPNDTYGADEVRKTGFTTNQQLWIKQLKDDIENEKFNSEQLESQLNEYKKRLKIRDGQPVFIHVYGKWRKAVVDAKTMSIRGNDMIGNTEGFEMRCLSLVLEPGWADQIKPRSRIRRVIKEAE